MNQTMKRLLALGLAGAMLLGLGACGKKEGGSAAETQKAGGEGSGFGGTLLSEELGFGYQSAYEDLADVKLSYINSASTAAGKLYLCGEWYDEETLESGTHLYARDLATGAVEEIPLPELEQSDNVRESIQRLTVCQDGSGYWLMSEKYTFTDDYGNGGDMVIFDDAVPEAAEEAPASPAEPEEAPGEIPGELPEAEPGMSGGPALNLLSETAVAVEEPAAEEPAAAEPAPVEDVETATEGDMEIYPDPNQEYRLRKCDMAGKVLQESDLVDVAAENNYFYCAGLAEDREGGVYVASDQKIYGFDAQGNRAETLEDDQMYINSLVSTGDGTILVSGWSSTGDGPALARLESGTLTPLEAAVDGTYGYTLYPGDGSSALVSDGSLLYSLDTATGTTEKILSWLDSDINGNNVTAVVADGAEKLLVLLQGYRQSTGMYYELGTLTRVPASEIPERTILTLGALYVDQNIQDAVIRYNRNSDAYRITLTDYSKYNTGENYDLGAEQMTKDIISGVCPDILCLSGGIGNLDRFVSKGALMDLSALMEQAGYDAGNLLSGPANAFTRDGRLYGVPLNCGLVTLYASSRLVGDRTGWTPAEMKQVAEGLDDGAKIMQWVTGPDFLNLMLYTNLGNFVDFGKATCSFDSQEFQDLLALAAAFPAEQEQNFEDEYVYQDEWQMLQAGDLLATYGYISDAWSVRNHYRLYLPENGIAHVGFPVTSGSGVMLTADSAIGISARCRHPEAAWDFLAGMLTDEAQGDQWSLPVTRTAMKKFLEEVMKPQTYVDEKGQTQPVEATGYIGDTEYKIGELTQDQADAFLHLMDEATPANDFDQNIMDIVSDEAAAFFSGDKTAKEVSDLIQNRVTIYLGEIS